LQRIAARMAPRATYERVLLPLIADLQFEHAQARSAWSRARARVRGVLAFWCVLLGSTAKVLAWGTTPDEIDAARQGWQRFGWSAGITCAVMVLLEPVPPELSSHPGRLLVLPSIAAVAVPVGILFSLALAPPAVRPVDRRARRRVTLASCLATLVLAAWITPFANQAYGQVLALAHVEGAPATPGDRGLTMSALANRAAELRAADRPLDAARLEVEWHKRPAMGVACLLLALIGAAIATTTWSRTERIVAATALVVAFGRALFVGERLADAGLVGAAAGAWAPLLLLALAVPVLRRAWRPSTFPS
jgi:hypothetical protein